MIIRHLQQNIGLVRDLGQSYQNGNLALFLGAGISKGCGLPDWEELLNHLVSTYFDQKYDDWREPEGWGHEYLAANTIREALDTSSNPAVARYIKRQLGDDFIPTLREALYQDEPQPSDAINSMAEMSKLAAICNYNYDDLLERVAEGPATFSPVACAADTPPGSAIPVYHVHGFLPSNGSATETGDLLLSEDDYHDVFRDAFHWSNTVQLSLLREHTCLLLGLSVDDPNLRRILDVVRSENVAQRRIVVMRIPPRVFRGPLIAAYTSWTRLQEAALGDLGLDILWIREYDEIPLILRSLSEPDPGMHYEERYPQERRGYH